ncbi:Uma2 family endonuclease [Streptomyces kunmingensis]
MWLAPREGEWGDLVDFWQCMEWPEGSRVEIVEGVVTVTPSAAPPHHFIAGDLHRALHQVAPAEWGIYQRLAIAVPSRWGMYLPDVLVMPEKGPRSGGYYVPADHAELAVEITSRSDAVQERVIKRDAYATAGIPLYLLVDRFAPGGPTVTLYGEPSDGAYRVLAETPFGEAVELPAPFELAVSTSDWPVP